jgi:DNA-binding response OmpR family regulator
MGLDTTSSTDAIGAILDGAPLAPEAFTAPRVAVIEGRPGGRAAMLLSSEGLSVERTDADNDGAAALIAAFAPHVVLLEVAGVSDDVVELCRRLEGVTSVPVILFSEGREEDGVLAAFAAGVRTVVSEPIGAHELVARVRAVLRRSKVQTGPKLDIVSAGGVSLDRARRVVTVHGRVVPMPRREYEIAELLLEHAGQVVSRTRLLRELWGTTGDSKSLAVQVGRLRARLSAITGRQSIVTVRGVGYRFVADQDEPSATVRGTEA